MDKDIENRVNTAVYSFIPEEMRKEVVDIIMKDYEDFKNEDSEQKAQRTYLLAKFYNKEKGDADLKNDEKAFENALKYAFAYFSIFASSTVKVIEECNNLPEKDIGRERRLKMINDFTDYLKGISNDISNDKT